MVGPCVSPNVGRDGMTREDKIRKRGRTRPGARVERPGDRRRGGATKVSRTLSWRVSTMAGL